jgi:hypothetical protein
MNKTRDGPRGSVALVRRIAGSPIPLENPLKADIRAENVSVDQPQPVTPGDAMGRGIPAESLKTAQTDPWCDFTRISMPS